MDCHVEEHVPGRLNDAGEGKSSEKRRLRPHGHGILCVVIELTLLNLRKEPRGTQIVGQW